MVGTGANRELLQCSVAE